MLTFNRWILQASTLFVILALLVFPAGPAGSASLAPAPSLYRHLDIGGPVGSGKFGQKTLALPNGNIVVTDPEYDEGGISDIGAVYLLDGNYGTIIDKILGSHAEDRVGSEVVALKNGNYVIINYQWHLGDAEQVGAVTWCSGVSGCGGVVSGINSLVGSQSGDGNNLNVIPLQDGDYVVISSTWNSSAGFAAWCSGTTGCAGTISDLNSLVGDSADDQVGFNIWELTNGNYVVQSPYWDDGGVEDIGAVKLCSGNGGCSGFVSSGNSLVGSSEDDNVGLVHPLENGNYVVSASAWDNTGAANAGAVAWCSGTTGCVGPVSESNSLVGTTAGDSISGNGAIDELASGNYVVRSPDWDNGSVANAGAATFCSGTEDCSGPVSILNSLVGSTAEDHVGSGIFELKNGSYVVTSYQWNNGSIVDAGAATWCHGSTGCQKAVKSSNSTVGGTDYDQVGLNEVVEVANAQYVIGIPGWDSGSLEDVGAVVMCNGPISCLGVPTSGNSLVGSQAGDQVGTSITALSNGNYVAASWYWNNGSNAEAGAVTWCSSSGCTGEVTALTSLVGSNEYDHVGGVSALVNGSYLVHASQWDYAGQEDVGAVTWCEGISVCAGEISPTTSLVGSNPNDRVGREGVALANGNYVVLSAYWGDGVSSNLGAVTWCSGDGSCVGPVNANNSLVGSSENDRVGVNGAIELKSGNYVVVSSFWDNNGVENAGAITWCSGSQGCYGPVSISNSLVGGQEGDYLGYSYGPNRPIIPLDNGDYIVRSYLWNNETLEHAGAVSLGSGFGNTLNGLITSDASILGLVESSIYSMSIGYDLFFEQLVVGKPAENVVSLLREPAHVFLPVIRR